MGILAFTAVPVPDSVGTLGPLPWTETSEPLSMPASYPGQRSLTAEASTLAAY